MSVFWGLGPTYLNKVLPDVYYGAYQPGETVSELDLQKWAEWEDAFFDLEQALQAKEKAKNSFVDTSFEPKGLRTASP